MANIIKGGHTVYGYDLGILMLDTQFPRMIGDVGNAQTWKFPVLYKVVRGARPSKVVLDLTFDDVAPFVSAAKELEAAGVKAITTSCGFLAMFQDELAQCLDVPVFTSSLLLLPLLARMFGRRKVLVCTANSRTLTEAHLKPVCGNLDTAGYEIIGTEDQPTFTNFTVQNWEQVDRDLCEAEILDVLSAKLAEKPREFGAILLECTNMPPYSDSIRKKFGLPVYDFVTFVNFVHSSTCRNAFQP